MKIGTKEKSQYVDGKSFPQVSEGVTGVVAHPGSIFQAKLV
jgi:hypothetical protein